MTKSSKHKPAFVTLLREVGEEISRSLANAALLIRSMKDGVVELDRVKQVLKDLDKTQNEMIDYLS